MHKIKIICNKKWELIAFLNAINYHYICGTNILENESIELSYLNDKRIITVSYKNIPFASLEFLCLQEYLSTCIQETNSKQKFTALNNLITDKSELIISVGTGTSTMENISNGSVLIGGHTFVYNPFKNTLDNNLLTKCSGTSLDMSCIIGHLEIIPEIFKIISKNVLPSPNVGGGEKVFKVDSNIVAISVTNIVNFNDYSTADFEAVNEFSNLHPAFSDFALDTTHGIIRWFSGAKFLFVNGITNRIGKYKIDFEPNYYTQGYVAAYNCGVVFKFILPSILKII